MRAVAGAQDSCAFALIAEVPGASKVLFDSAVIQGSPELALAIRNAADEGAARGLPNRESWTLVATPEWTDSIRPDAKSRWDKEHVAERMLEAFAKVTGQPKGRALRPVYHWGGFASLTNCTQHLFAFDSNARLGFAGDFFLGHGADEALQSGSALAEHIAKDLGSSMPGKDDWILRKVANDAEETAALYGRPAGTADHAWPTHEQLASGVLPRGERCMDRYTRRGLWDKDVAWLQSKGTGIDVSWTKGKRGKDGKSRGKGGKDGTAGKEGKGDKESTSPQRRWGSNGHGRNSKGIQGYPK
eukprot:gnl/MRDRNA2_/MRDRNA2_15184_c0_seq1.p1 gnl/MRDRNA2_/MRDRNA2_15184_c0~~gnl/MRDRNA2_/MRDRNA2_15184_c0_seq1.p1  ORF type:complete len:349 (+),score=75.62 gnl/MRDRNA2_/MRDRNA2_15184_c0_seq1:147-1049(+)